jgi:hypothetical protein
MFKNLVIRKGIIRGQTIVLEGSHGLPEGQAVLVGIGVPDTEAKEELAQELEANEALGTIYRMRHAGRSSREL